MPRSEPSLRQQLLDAREKIQRQIEILRAGPASLGKGGGLIDNSGLIVELSETLRGIDESLAKLGPAASMSPSPSSRGNS